MSGHAANFKADTQKQRWLKLNGREMPEYLAGAVGAVAVVDEADLACGVFAGVLRRAAVAN